jgi:hypothetical protein
MEAQPSLVDNCPSNKTTGVPLLKSKPPLYPKYQILTPTRIIMMIEIINDFKQNAKSKNITVDFIKNPDKSVYDPFEKNINAIKKLKEEK